MRSSTRRAARFTVVHAIRSGAPSAASRSRLAIGTLLLVAGATSLPARLATWIPIADALRYE